MFPLALALALLAGIPAVDSPQPMTVTYVGNCGYLVETQGKKLAIDAFFGGKPSEYYDMPSDSIVALMTAAKPPFDNIDLIAVTHWHHDHFNAEIVAQHMQANPKAVLLCPSQVADRLRLLPEYADVSPRIQAINIPIDSVTRYQGSGLSALVLSSRHGSYFENDSTGKSVDIHRETQNLEFLITLGDRTVFHCGDAVLDTRCRYQLLGMGKDSIDVAFVQQWGCHDMPLFGEKIVREEMLPRNIFFTHLAPGKGARWAAEPTCRSHHGVTIPARQLQTWTLPGPRR